MSVAPFIVVLTTLPVDHDAARFARILVDERLAACVGINPPMQSIYRWQGAIESADERQLVIKTTGERFAALRDRLAELHPYEVPELLVLAAIDGGEAYLGWMEESTATRR